MDKKISFLSLNIGNPSLDRARKQCEWLDKRPEDVFILTETKNSQGCSYIEDFFTIWIRFVFYEFFIRF